LRATDDRLREGNERRVERMNTWIELAEASPHDHVRFVFYWIAYEAAYQNDNRGSGLEDWKEREEFHDKLARHDGTQLANIMDGRRAEVRRILELRQADPCFWQKRWKVRRAEEWEKKFGERVRRQLRQLNRAITDAERPEVSAALNNLFRNLSIVRHQIVHGGSAGPRSRGRTQVILGAGLLKALVPCFRDSIKSNIDQDWGEPPYPRVGSMPDEKCPPPWL
jgi:hypothetical protein